MTDSYFHRLQSQTATMFWVNNPRRQESGLAIAGGAMAAPAIPRSVRTCGTTARKAAMRSPCSIRS